jgi:potassium-transporting ATPase KdpC subunit
MRRTVAIALRATVVTLLLCGLLYPALVTLLARVLFPGQAAGSLVADERGRTVGSALIAQRFDRPEYLRPRPSAAGEKGWDATASGGSNLGPTSRKLRDRARAEIARLHRENPGARGPVPDELVTASGSGLDPHLSPAAALWQVPRVARARGVAEERVRALVEARVEGPDLGLLGEPRINVLLVNLALDRQFGRMPARAGAPHTWYEALAVKPGQALHLAPEARVQVW